MTDVEFSVAKCAEFARALPYAEALRFVRGVVLLAGEREEVERLHSTLLTMESSDRQLELIASGQLKLDLTTGDKA